MKTRIIKTILVASLTLFTLCAFTQKQKNIVIDETLEANSEAMKIKMGSQVFGKMAKYKFGDYSVIEGKVAGVSSSGSSNLLETKQQVKSKTKFSFVMADKSADRATVNAAVNQEIKSTSEQKLIAFYYVGENELLLNKHNFSATIFLNKDTSNLWLLYMNRETGSQSKNSGTAFMTNGKRKILIISASSNKNGTDSRTFPAMGYEFTENEQTLSAIQYYGGGMFGLNKGLVWLDNRLDSQLKLILSSAMTALLHMQLDELYDMENMYDYENW